MKKLYSCLNIFLFFLVPQQVISQCNSLTATCTGYESRCAATGSIKINASGGSGNYKYKTFGPVNSNFTSTDSITGLSAGSYAVLVNDITTHCTFTVNNVIVEGSYQDPRFTLNKVDVSCDNGSNGSISLADYQFGLAPFVYSIAAPSPMGVGTSSSEGVFENLSAGDYFIRLTDSCGGIQTRQITINNYNWSLVEYPFVKTSCSEASGYIKVTDSRGNISTVSGIPGFMYGIVKSAGDTIWSSNPYFTFSLFGNNNIFEVVAKDSCGTIKKAPVNISLDPEVGVPVLITNKACSTFSASLTGIKNFFVPQFCLYDSVNTFMGCNSTGSFDNLPYGNYCIRAYDVCNDITITRCFSATPPPISIGNTVLISNKNCTDFTATITNQSGLTNPEFCLYDSNNTILYCNSTGVFYNLGYGNYCITTRDGCRDTLITRCFSAIRPSPYIAPIVPSYNDCVYFGIVVGGDTLSNPQYCLYDTNGVLILCNSTGIFDSIPLGTYCINVYDSCYDTTIVQCFTVGMPIILNDLLTRITDRACTTFNVTVAGASLNWPTYCLYNDADSLLSCNRSGIFNNLIYGSYCIKAQNTCPDTLLIHCFAVQQNIPTVDAAVSTSNTNCFTFKAFITGQAYLSNEEYCIYDSANNLIECNTRGAFANLPYGSYCIKIRDNCYDTIITRCFTRLKTPLQLATITDKSCTIGYSKITINISGAILPVQLSIYNPGGSFFLNSIFHSSNIVVDSVPAVPVGEFYKIYVTDDCGNRDSVNTGAVTSFFNYNTRVIPKCPGSSWANGSGNIVSRVSTNLGDLTVRIIEKDGILYSNPLVPNSANNGEFIFTDLGPGNYIIRSNENICNNFIYDTITIRPYLFPNLTRSSAYQCDVDGFSVSAIASNGVAPFMYEIIGSIPANPSIIAAPQTNSIFNINNGATYSLIRLRAQDACGNATLGDASILPLANNGITVTENCLFYPTTLSVDIIYSATYEWYKKETENAVDSTFMGATPHVTIPSVLPSDTGIYICYLNVNQGCIKRRHIYHLNGSCYIILSVNLQDFKGKQENNKHILYWKTSKEQEVEKYFIERQTASADFTILDTIVAKGINPLQTYSYVDAKPEPGNNFYRLKILYKNGSFGYSHTILMQRKKMAFDYIVYPNPAKERLSIQFNHAASQHYTISLFNLSNRLIFQQKISVPVNGLLEITRPPAIQPGMYLIRITNPLNGEQLTQKLIFL
jgi:Secretion system C-terminal sorting domain/SprB repeat